MYNHIYIYIYIYTHLLNFETGTRIGRTDAYISAWWDEKTTPTSGIVVKNPENCEDPWKSDLIAGVVSENATEKLPDRFSRQHPACHVCVYI